MTAADTAFKRLFALGMICSTPRAYDGTDDELRFACLCRHASGDFGCVPDEDAATNASNIRNGGRILSAYPIDPSRPSKGYGKNTLWIITEADRSVTTFLLPEEY